MAPVAFPHLARVAGLAHALVPRGASARAVATDLGFSRTSHVSQVHGARVAVMDVPQPEPPPADVIVLRRPGVLGAVRGADCPLALLVESDARALALVHSGWRGTVAGVVPRAIEALVEVAGADPARLLVGMAPSICGACYEVGEEVAAAVESHVPKGASFLAATRPGHATLDLRGAITAQLEAAGVHPSNVHAHPDCTYENASAWHSYRRDGHAAGRHVLMAGWRVDPD